MADVAWSFHFQPSELAKMTVKQLLWWHGEAARLRKASGGILRI